MRRLLTLFGVLSLSVVAGSAPVCAQAVPGRCSQSYNGVAGSLESEEPAISADGRYVAFTSLAPNLVPGDLDSDADVFVRDCRTGFIDRVSLGLNGAQPSAWSGQPSLSADGRYVCFASAADNLVPGDTNGVPDIFVLDRVSHVTVRASVSSGGFEGNGDSSSPRISASGRYVVFTSQASNLVPGDTNGYSDVFLHDLQTGLTERVSVGAGGIQGDAPSGSAVVSADGRFVAFVSDARNFAGEVAFDPDVFVRDRLALDTTLVSRDAANQPRGGGAPSISADGHLVAFETTAALLPSDLNAGTDIYVRDLQTGQLELISVATSGAAAQGFTLPPPNPPVFVDADSYGASISGDGRYVAFASLASNFDYTDLNDGPDVFVHDRMLQQTARVSVDAAGIGANISCRWNASAWDVDRFTMRLALSGDGQHIAYESTASNLVPGDVNGLSDVFALDLFPRLDYVGGAQVGNTLQLDLNAPAAVGQHYLVALSGAYNPGIPVDIRHIPLVDDALLELSLVAPSPIFAAFSGMISPAGTASAYLNIPNQPALIGTPFYAAYVTFDSSAPSGVSGISNAQGFYIVP